jgi:transcriptional regulator with XRE-family HTH domain
LHPGNELKTLRSRLGITLRDVAELSQKIADVQGNPEFYVSNPWLTQIENSDAVPSIFKLYSLSVIYRVKFSDVLLLFGVDLQKVRQHEFMTQLPHTHLTTIEIYDSTKTVSFPIRFDPTFDLDNTNLLTRMVEIWGEVPIAFIQHLDIRHSLYGYIGLQDLTLSPMLRPGSFVQVDPKVKRVRAQQWRTEYERPIYFVELRQGYACSWCELQDEDLLLVPHPLSSCNVRRLRYGVDAEIVGQVTAVAMRLVLTPDPALSSGGARLPQRT